MTKAAIFTVLCLFIISAAGASVIITSYTPESATQSVFIMLYSSLLGLATSIFAGIIHFFKKVIGSKYITHNIWISIRQGFFLASIITISLFLNSLRILSIWEIAPLSIAIILLEFFFQADKKDVLS